MNISKFCCPRCGGSLHYTNLDNMNCNGLSDGEILMIIDRSPDIIRAKCIGKCKRENKFYLYFIKNNKWYQFNIPNKRWIRLRIKQPFIFR